MSMACSNTRRRTTVSSARESSAPAISLATSSHAMQSIPPEGSASFTPLSCSALCDAVTISPALTHQGVVKGRVGAADRCRASHVRRQTRCDHYRRARTVGCCSDSHTCARLGVQSTQARQHATAKHRRFECVLHRHPHAHQQREHLMVLGSAPPAGTRLRAMSIGCGGTNRFGAETGGAIREGSCSQRPASSSWDLPLCTASRADAALRRREPSAALRCDAPAALGYASAALRSFSRKGSIRVWCS